MPRADGTIWGREMKGRKKIREGIKEFISNIVMDRR